TYFLSVAAVTFRTHCEMNHVEFVPLNDVNAFQYGNPLNGLQEDGTLFIQSSKTDPAEVWAAIPYDSQEVIRKRNIRVFALNTVKIAREIAPTADLEMRMQGIVLAGIFLRVAPIVAEANVTQEDLFTRVEDALRKWFGKRGEAVVQANVQAVSRGYEEVFEIPAAIITPPQEEEVA
ncbi:MAG: 2-oxoacid:acceptor oxidoreductase family protein, partial [Candidatus Poribacteria bacterium]